MAGWYLPPPAPTGWAVLHAVLWIGLPLLAALILLDLLLYLAVTRLFGGCYGLFCLIA